MFHLGDSSLVTHLLVCVLDDYELRTRILKNNSIGVSSVRHRLTYTEKGLGVLSVSRTLLLMSWQCLCQGTAPTMSNSQLGSNR